MDLETSLHLLLVVRYGCKACLSRDLKREVEQLGHLSLISGDAPYEKLQMSIRGWISSHSNLIGLRPFQSPDPENALDLQHEQIRVAFFDRVHSGKLLAAKSH